MTEHDLPFDVSQLIDDVSANGAVIVLRENRSSIRITPEPEIDPAREEALFAEAMDALKDSNTRWYESTDAFMADLEAGDE